MTLALVALLFATGCSFASVVNVSDASTSLVAEIVDKYYAQRQVPVLLETSASVVHMDLLNQVVSKLKLPRVIQFDPAIADYKSWFYVMFFVENFRRLQSYLDQLCSDRYDLFGYYTVVLTQANESDVTATFNALWRLKITRAVIVVVDHDYPQLYNYAPYSKHTCGKPSVRRIRPHTDMKLFESRLNDFHDCSLRLGTFQSLPFINFPPLQGNRSTVTGFEGDLVSTISAKLRITLQIVEPPDNGQWGIPRRNGSTGLMKILQEETVHFGVGCLVIIADRNEILQPGQPHYGTHLVFAVPGGRPYNALEKLFRPLDSTTWILILATFGLAGVTVVFLKFAPEPIRELVYGLNNRSAFLGTVEIFFSGVIFNFPKHNFARTLLLLWIVFCFVIRTVYQGSLYKHLQADSKHKAVETLDEIEHSGLYYHMLKISERFFQNNSRVLSRVRNIQTGNDSINNILDAIATQRLQDGVALVTSEHIAFHNKHKLDQGFVRSTRDSVVAAPIVIYYPKRSFLVKEFNLLVGRIQMAGLIDYWVQRYGNYDFFPKEIKDKRPVAMNIRLLTGSYECCAILLVTSWVVFLLELLSTRVPFIRYVLEFLADKK